MCSRFGEHIAAHPSTEKTRERFYLYFFIAFASVAPFRNASFRYPTLSSYTYTVTPDGSSRKKCVPMAEARKVTFSLPSLERLWRYMAIGCGIVGGAIVLAAAATLTARRTAINKLCRRIARL